MWGSIFWGRKLPSEGWRFRAETAYLTELRSDANVQGCNSAAQGLQP